MIVDLLGEFDPLRPYKDRQAWSIERSKGKYIILDHGIQAAVFSCDTLQEALEIAPQGLGDRE
jgi:hypothetical protein